MEQPSQQQHLQELYTTLCTVMKEKLNGDPELIQSSDLNVVRQFLKDQNFTGIPVAGSPLLGLLENMPNFDDKKSVNG
jgi:hypothetical protein